MNEAEIRPVRMWAPVSPEGMIYPYGIDSTRSRVIKKWEEGGYFDWKKDRANGWRLVRVLVIPESQVDG